MLQNSLGHCGGFLFFPKDQNLCFSLQNKCLVELFKKYHIFDEGLQMKETSQPSTICEKALTLTTQSSRQQGFCRSLQKNNKRRRQHKLASEWIDWWVDGWIDKDEFTVGVAPTTQLVHQWRSISTIGLWLIRTITKGGKRFLPQTGKIYSEANTLDIYTKNKGTLCLGHSDTLSTTFSWLFH